MYFLTAFLSLLTATTLFDGVRLAMGEKNPSTTTDIVNFVIHQTVGLKMKFNALLHTRFTDCPFLNRTLPASTKILHTGLILLPKDHSLAALLKFLDEQHERQGYDNSREVNKMIGHATKLAHKFDDFPVEVPFGKIRKYITQDVYRSTMCRYTETPRTAIEMMYVAQESYYHRRIFHGDENTMMSFDVTANKPKTSTDAIHELHTAQMEIIYVDWTDDDGTITHSGVKACAYTVAQMWIPHFDGKDARELLPVIARDLLCHKPRMNEVVLNHVVRRVKLTMVFRKETTPDGVYVYHDDKSVVVICADPDFKFDNEIVREIRTCTIESDSSDDSDESDDSDDDLEIPLI